MNKNDKHNIDNWLSDAEELERKAKVELQSGQKAQAVISLAMAHDNRAAADRVRRGLPSERGGSSWTKYVPQYKHLDDPAPSLEEQLSDLERRIQQRGD